MSFVYHAGKAKFAKFRSRSGIRHLIGIFLATIATTATGLALTGSAYGSTTTTSVANSTGSGCNYVHLGPYLRPGSAASSYLQITLNPGDPTLEALILANPEPYPCTVTLIPAFGKTAVNSGDTYPIGQAGSAPCSSESCWITKLQQSVVLAPQSRVNIPFLVTVPAGTSSGEYLAGIVGEPDQSQQSITTTTEPGRETIGATVETRVAIGIAITVPGPLAPHLTVPKVTVGSSTTPLPTIEVTESDTGNTWLHPTGTLEVTVGSTNYKFPFTSNTVLPGNQATIPVSVDVPAGTHISEVELSYDGKAKQAVWHGSLDFPSPPQSHVSQGIRTVVVGATGTPAWESELLIALAVIVVILGAALLLQLRRKKKLQSTGDS